MSHEFVKILGGPSAESTTQSHEFELPDGSTLSLLITIHSKEPPLSRIEAIRGVVNFIHHEISKTEITFESLKHSLSSSLLHPPFDSIVVYNKENLVYVFVVGNVEALLFRGGALTKLVSGESVVRGASGFLKEGDALTMATRTFLDVVSVTELTGYVARRQFEALEQDSATRIEGNPNHGSAGVGFLLTENLSEITPQQEEEEEIPEVESDAPAQIEKQSIEDVTPEPEIVGDSTAPEPLFATATDSIPFRERFFVKRENPYEARGKSRRLAYVGILLLLLLGGSIFFGMKTRKAKEEASRVKETLASAQEALSQAKSIAPVNKTRARDLILEARAQVLGVSTTNKTYPELTAMGDALTESLGDVAGVYEIEPTVFSDLALISQDTKATDISLSDNILRILSNNDKRVMTIELPGKRTETLPGTSMLRNPTAIAAYAMKEFVVDTGGLYEFGKEQKKQFDLPGSTDDLLIGAFAGNIYMVQKSANAIWRYAGNGGVFSEKTAWLAPGVEIDLSKAKSMSIDGSIWVLSETGKITKFTTGNPQVVNLRGLPAPLSSESMLYTDDVDKYLYVLDPTQKSIYVCEKSGDLVATYTHPDIERTHTLVVSEENSLIILAGESKLLSLPTRHIR